jgi:hypothetical protein
MAPIPKAVSDHGPKVFFSRCSGCSDSAISLSMDFLAKSWLARSASFKRTWPYLFAVPRAIFLTFCFCDPRAYSRGFLGASFLRDARFAFLRSSLLNALVFAIHLS